MRASAEALARRHEIFKNDLEAPIGDGKVPGWKVISQSGCFAFVRHPFKSKGSREIARLLASEHGVVTLPGVFFGYPMDEKSGEVVEGGELDRYIRFSVGNVGDEEVRSVCGRLREWVGSVGVEELD